MLHRMGPIKYFIAYPDLRRLFFVYICRHSEKLPLSTDRQVTSPDMA